MLPAMVPATLLTHSSPSLAGSAASTSASSGTALRIACAALVSLCCAFLTSSPFICATEKMRRRFGGGGTNTIREQNEGCRGGRGHCLCESSSDGRCVDLPNVSISNLQNMKKLCSTHGKRRHSPDPYRETKALRQGAYFQQPKRTKPGEIVPAKDGARTLCKTQYLAVPHRPELTFLGIERGALLAVRVEARGSRAVSRAPGAFCAPRRVSESQQKRL